MHIGVLGGGGVVRGRSQLRNTHRKVLAKNLHDLGSIGRHFASQGAAQVPHQTNRSNAHLCCVSQH